VRADAGLRFLAFLIAQPMVGKSICRFIAVCNEPMFLLPMVVRAKIADHLRRAEAMPARGAMQPMRQMRSDAAQSAKFDVFFRLSG
jgi:hypothetical protein